MTDKKEKSNVIPLMPGKKARDIIKKQFDNPPGDKGKERREDKSYRDHPLFQETVDKINKKMDELRQLTAEQPTAKSAGEIPRYSSEAVVQTKELASTLPTQEELDREYRRKQDEMRKKREHNNKAVTRDYNLHRPGKGNPYRDK